VAFLVALAILFATAYCWERWVARFFGVPGVIKSLLMLSTGHLLNLLNKTIPRVEALALLASCVLLIVLTLAISHRVMKATDRVFLVVATVAFWSGASASNGSTCGCG